MKKFLKYILKQLKLLKAVRKIIYWFKRFDANFTHPERTAVQFYSQFIKREDLCFDVGANTGNKTKIFLELGAKVICIEPQKECLGGLYKLFGKNKNIRIVNKGVADRDGFLDLSVCKEMPNISTFSDKFKKESIFRKAYGCQWTKAERVPVTTLDILIFQFGMPRFCKIDIEGFEELALKGLTKPIPFISFEYDDYFFEDMEKCISRLLEIGSYIFNFTIAEPSDGRGLILMQWVGPEELIEKLYGLKKGNVRLWGDIYAKLSNV